MPDYDRDAYSPGCAIELESRSNHDDLNLGEYLLESGQRLETIKDKLGRGEIVGSEMRDWMLDQVDLIVNVVGDENLELGDELRSNLLQLLLSVANLNEQIRQQASLHL